MASSSNSPGPAEYSLQKIFLQELDYYKNEIELKKDEITNAINAKKTDLTISIVVLTLIAAIAAGGGAALIATSGGPLANTLSFSGGVALTAISGGMLIWMVIVIVRASRFNDEKKKDYTQFVTDRIADDKILNAMRQQGVQRENIQLVINKMRSAHFAQFVSLAISTIFPAGRQEPLTAQEEAILSCIAEHEHFTEVMVQEGRTASRISLYHQCLVLEYIPQRETNTAVRRMGQDLFNAHAGAVIETESPLPQIPAAIAQDDKLLGLKAEDQRSVMKKMTPEQANAFVAKLGEQQYKALVTQAMDEENEKVLKALATSVHTSSLTPQQQLELMEQVDATTAVEIVNRLNPGQFQALATKVEESYFTVEGLEIFKHVLEAMYEQAGLLTPKQNYTFLNWFDLKTANATIPVLNRQSYEALVAYAITQSQNQNVLRVIAQRSADFARMVGNEALSAEEIHQIVSQMDHAQKAEFLRVVTDRAIEIRGLLAGRVEFEKIEGVVSGICEATLTLEFGDLFSREEVDSNAQALAAQLARWPDKVSEVLSKSSRDIFTKAGLLNAFYNAMDASGKVHAVSVLADLFTKKNPDLIVFAQALLSIENFYIRELQPIKKPEFLNHALDKVYIELARVCEKLSHNDFRARITDNKSISKESQDRHLFALLLLERMNLEEAKRLINDIDRGKWGHNRYKGMFECLVKEAMFLPKRGNEAEDNRISNRRKTLYFLFNTSENKKNILEDLNAGFRNPKDDWENFLELAVNMDQ